MSPNKPLIRPTWNKTKPWETAEDLIYTLSDSTTMYIQARYKTDFASVPTLLKLFTDPVGKDCSAFIVHDYLYSEGGYYKTKAEYNKYTDEGWVTVDRKFADNELKHRQIKLGASKLRVFCYYFAVRIFGVFEFNTI